MSRRRSAAARAACNPAATMAEEQRRAVVQVGGEARTQDPMPVAAHVAVLKVPARATADITVGEEA